VQERRPLQLRVQHRASGREELCGPDAKGGDPGPEHRYLEHHRGLDRRHLAHVPQARALGLLRADRGPARLRQRRSRDLCPDYPERDDAGYLEPAPHLRGRPEGRPTQEHPALELLLRLGQGGDPARRLVGHPLPGRQRPPAGQRPPGSGVCDRRDERRHEESRLELDRHLLAVGRLGRLLRQRRPPPRSTRTATASACQRW